MSDTSDSDTLTAEVVDSVEAVEASQWNRLAGTANPFVRHEFLAAMERNGCVGDDSGWSPRHVLVRRDGELLGAMPVYAKHHSYGEFVFDWGWAEAYERAGLDYYPKLVCAVPFTPATGPRLLREPGLTERQHGELLVAAAIQVARASEVSSLHWLFTDERDTEALRGCGLMVRSGHQYHWHNPGFRDFEDFLDSLNSKRRKQIRRERREAAAAPVEIEVLRGPEATGAHWQAYHRLYASTYDRKWGYPSLTPEFFEEVGETMPESAILILARRDGRFVAGAHLYAGSDALFGRNWGCSEFHASLHFEMCYYRGIELCIDNGWSRFEAGAQGEHKIFRGFLPVETHSAHWVAHPQFREAIESFLDRERAGVDHHIEGMRAHSPFKDRGPPRSSR